MRWSLGAHVLNPVQVATFTDNFASNDFCLLHLDRAVENVPIYEVAVPEDVFVREDAIIVGYGVNNSGVPQGGSGGSAQVAHSVFVELSPSQALAASPRHPA
eukprot:SAG31_NODE_6108_length_2169_cov_1.860386_2_plen_102_part_00